MEESSHYPIETFLDALHEGDLSRAKHGIKAGVSSDWRDPDGCSALFYALYRSDWAMAELLLDHGADINAPDIEGWTPLFWAASSGHTDVVSFLLNHRADPNIQTNDGEWALFWAVYEGYVDIVRLLLKAGPRLDWFHIPGRDVIQLAQTLKHKEIEELLITAERT